ncbi:MAG TPA: protein kinase [Pyrinomonadaceae bacterium]|nr:protein kinase [Pyrinomonadaceae bacterium]
MSPERWQRIEKIFEAALALSPTERESFLVEACGEDAELRAQVEAMLSADEKENSLELSVADWGASVLFAEEKEDLDRNIGRRIGNYRIVREIGRGGMGAVYEALRDDAEFDQRVAVKLIKRGKDTDYALRRFRHERQILANLNHPFIARLFDGGTTAEDNLPYFVMEYVEGTKITIYCEKNKLDLAERLRLIAKVCSAIDYAHKQQVVHRDIKPGNILVTNDGQVKLLDFGIAKFLDPEKSGDDTLDSMTGRMMMTPEYASPEQVRGLPATPAGDIYSLGILLYQLVTGEHPFQKQKSAAIHELARAICEDTPVPPSSVIKGEKAGDENGHGINSDLDAVILKTLRKNAGERYASAAELAVDIENYLHGRPVNAAPLVQTPAAPPPDEREKTIAVLPFKIFNLTPDADETDKRFLGLGLTDALITRLSNVRNLTVRPTSAVLRYSEDSEAKDLFAVGRELQAGFVLDGRITFSSERLRVTVQLIDVKDRTSLWAGQYNEKFTDIFAVQDLISGQVSSALAAELTETERENLAKHGTENSAAYEAYLRGRAIWHSYTEQGMARAIQYFQEAVRLDPKFAAAHSGIADLHIALGIGSVIAPTDAFGIAKASARRAVELDPNSAEAYASLGFAVWAIDWDADESEKLFRKSFALNENYAAAHEWFAHVLASRGRFDEAVEQMMRALKIDPQSSQLNAMTAYILHNGRRHREAAFYIERAVELEPDNYIALQGFGWIYPPLGKTGEAIAFCRRAVEISNRAPFCLWTLAQVLAETGEKAESLSLLDELREIAAARYVSPYYAAMIYTTLGEYDRAFGQLEKVFDNHDYWAQWLGVEHRFDAIRQDPRFVRLLKLLSQHNNPGEETTEPVGSERENHTRRESAENRLEPVKNRRAFQIAAVAALLVVLALGGALFVRNFYQSPPRSENLWIKKITRVTTSGQVLHAVISPDASIIAYTAEENGVQGIWTKQIGAPNSNRIVSDADLRFSGIVFSPNGKEIFYVAQKREDSVGSLFRVPAAGGTSQKVLDDVYNRIDFAPGGNRFVFRRRNFIQGEDLLLVADAGGANVRQIASRRFPEMLLNPAWSPDGKTIGVGVVNSDSGTRQQYGTVVLLPADGAGEERILGDKRWGLVTYIAWQGDGKALYVCGQNELNFGSIQVWRVFLDRASTPEPVTSDTSDYRGISVAKSSNTMVTVKSDIHAGIWTTAASLQSINQAAAKANKPLTEEIFARVSSSDLAGFKGLSFAPDGRIVYTTLRESFIEIWRMNADGANPHKLIDAPHDVNTPVVSPDNRYIVYVSDVKGVSRLWRADIDGSNNLELTRGDKDETPQFSPDGKWVVFTRTIDGRSRLAKIPVEGGEATPIGQMTAQMPVVSPDGKTIAFILIDRTTAKMALMPFDGDYPTKIFETPLMVAGKPYYSAAIHWSPDGSAVNFLRDEKGVSNVWSQPADGRPPKKLTDFNTGEIFYFGIARGENGSPKLVLSRGTHASDAMLITLSE